VPEAKKTAGKTNPASSSTLIISQKICREIAGFKERVISHRAWKHSPASNEQTSPGQREQAARRGLHTDELRKKWM
jgi:hypothetical protein